MIPFVRDFDFAYGVVDQVSPLIRRIVANNPGPFTYVGTGVYIVGHGQVAVIDPGPDLPDHWQALQSALTGETVTHVFVTHGHLDHSPLARKLAQAHGAKVYASARTHIPSTDTETFEEGEDADFAPDIALSDGDVFHGPGWSLETIATPGHTASHLCFALPQENALFSGDHIMGWSTTVVAPPDGSMADYLGSLEKIRARGFATLWPTHGPPVTDVAPFIDAYIAHRLERERQILTALRQGPQTIAQLVPQMYVDLDPRLIPAASHSVYAHLLKLVTDSVVTCPTPTMASVYALRS